MALRLRIVSAHRRALGSRSAVVLGVAGGSIGRSADNDLVLPDRSLFVSGQHARVSFREGRYFIEDTSTNGVWVNESPDPLPRREPVELHDGDILRFGGYHVLVTLSGNGDAGASAGAGATGRADGTIREAVVLPFTGARAARTLSEPGDDDAAQRAGLEALARGAGIDPAQLRGAEAGPALQLAGRLLRGMLVGLKSLDAPGTGGNTAKQLVGLLGSADAGDSSSETWLREQFAALRAERQPPERVAERVGFEPTCRD